VGEEAYFLSGCEYLLNEATVGEEIGENSVLAERTLPTWPPELMSVLRIVDPDACLWLS